MSKMRFSEIVLEKNKNADIQATHNILNMWEPKWEQHGSEISQQRTYNGYYVDRITPNTLLTYSHVTPMSLPTYWTCGSQNESNMGVKYLYNTETMDIM